MRLTNERVGVFLARRSVQHLVDLSSCDAGTADTPGAPEFTPYFRRIHVLYVLRVTASDYHFGMFNLFYQDQIS